MVRIDAAHVVGHERGPRWGTHTLVEELPEVGVNAPARHAVRDEALLLADELQRVQSRRIGNLVLRAAIGTEDAEHDPQPVLAG
jgi:hypothetical protein